MADPSSHSARTVAERSQTIVGSDVDRVESLALADAAGDEAEQWGAWIIAGEGRPA